jgi:hypothetical protein
MYGMGMVMRVLSQSSLVIDMEEIPDSDRRVARVSFPRLVLKREP